MTFGQFLWGWEWAFGLIAFCMVLPASRRDIAPQTFGRLVATAFTLIGIDLASSQRFFEDAPLTGVLVVAIPLIDFGLFLYVLFLPQRGVLALIVRVRAWLGRGGGDG